jgi:hypothetical protein
VLAEKDALPLPRGDAVDVWEVSADGDELEQKLCFIDEEGEPLESEVCEARGLGLVDVSELLDAAGLRDVEDDAEDVEERVADLLSLPLALGLADDEAEDVEQELLESVELGLAEADELNEAGGLPDSAGD